MRSMSILKTEEQQLELEMKMLLMLEMEVGRHGTQNAGAGTKSLRVNTQHLYINDDKV